MNPTGELIKKYLEAHNRHEVESVKAMLADSHVFSTCHGMEMSGDQYVATIGSLMEAFPDVHFDIRKVYVEGDKEYADILASASLEFGVPLWAMVAVGLKEHPLQSKSTMPPFDGLYSS